MYLGHNKVPMGLSLHYFDIYRDGLLVTLFKNYNIFVTKLGKHIFDFWPIITTKLIKVRKIVLKNLIFKGIS
jgi:hypothetical protein